MICTHALTEFCSCLERRPPVYTRPHVEMRGPGERLPEWRCTCRDPFTNRPLLRKYRHTSEIECRPQEDVDAFKAQHGIKSDGLARALLFIETFAAGAGR